MPPRGAMFGSYFALALLGALLPLSQFIPWLLDHGLDARLFVAELFSTRIGSFFGWDVIVTALVLILFVLAEGRRHGIGRLWMPIAATLCIGVSCGFPLFLAMRERHRMAASLAA
jgi:GNAT superfamily N-acetyltransferase